MINWLHISDLHLGSEGAVTGMMRDALPDYLKGLGVSCEYVFCTGDIRTANADPNVFTDEMAAYLKKVCDAVGVPTERLFIVIGNHDVDRTVAGRHDAIKNVLFDSKGYYNPDDGIIKKEDMSVIMEGEKEFVTFLGKIYDADRIKYYGNAQTPHFNIETEHFNVLHVDTVLSYTEGQERNDLYMGTNLLYKVVQTLNKAKPTILLNHYPYTSLMQGEKKVLSTMLQHNNIRLWLAGHEHDQVLQRLHYIYSLQAGVLRKEQGAGSSVLMGAYEPTTGECSVTAHAWFDEGWGKYPYVDLDNTPKDVFCCNLLAMKKHATIPDDMGKVLEGLSIEGVELDVNKNTAVSVVTTSNHIIERTGLVEKGAKALDSGKVLVLHGGVKIGKSVLARQIRERRPSAGIYDVVAQANLEATIAKLLQDGKGGGSIVVSRASLDMSLADVDGNQICQMEVPLMSFEETAALIATYQPEKDLNLFIWAISNGHPVLVRTLCGYLSTHHWTAGEKNFSNLLNYSFDNSLRRSLAELVRTLVTDAAERSLLNRLLTVNGIFTEDDAIKLAGVDPAIDEPRLHLYALMPTWLMANDGLFRVTPLIDKVWRPDVPEQTLKECYLLLAAGIMEKRVPLGEQDVLNYILYSLKGEADDDAGRMYVTVMLKLQEQGGVPRRCMLNALWIDIPLPKGMAEEVKIGVRYLQLVLVKGLKPLQRSYLLNDLKALVAECKDAERIPFYTSMVSMVCWMEGDAAGGMDFYHRYLTHKEDGAALLDRVEDAVPVFDNNIWMFLLQLDSEDGFLGWLESFDATAINYAHDDRRICEFCYLSVERLWKHHLKERTAEEKMVSLAHIQEKAMAKVCDELVIACVFARMEIMNAERRHDEVRQLYQTYYPIYQKRPMASFILNASMGNSYFRDVKDEHQQALSYFKQALTMEDTEFIPNIQLHVRQLLSYVLAEQDERAAVEELERALQYATKKEHRVDLYEYYQSMGELSYAYWCAGDRVKAVERLEQCLRFTCDELMKGEKRYAKSFMCLLGVLILKYQFDIDGKPIPDNQAKPHHGMFTENDLLSFDDLYQDDRLYTQSYQMCQLCKAVGLNVLAAKWAHRVVEVCKARGEVREIHYLIFLLLPYFVAENDAEAIRFVIAHSCEAKRISYEYHPEQNKGNGDFEFVEFCIVPLLMASLSQKLRNDNTGLELIKQILEGYRPMDDVGKFERVKDIFRRDTYDRNFIAEINRLDVNEDYAEYVCAYLMTAFYSEASYAFSLMIAVLPVLETRLVTILGEDARAIFNRFVADFWKARILTAPREFNDYQHLKDKGLKLIEQYEGSPNLANHTMLIVVNHVNMEVRLNAQQEAWMDE